MNSATTMSWLWARACLTLAGTMSARWRQMMAFLYSDQHWWSTFTLLMERSQTVLAEQLNSRIFLVSLQQGTNISSDIISSSNLSHYYQTCKKFIDGTMFRSLVPMIVLLPSEVAQIRIRYFGWRFGHQSPYISRLFSFPFLLVWNTSRDEFLHAMSYHCQSLGENIFVPFTRKTQQKLVVSTKFWLNSVTFFVSFPAMVFVISDISAYKN